MELRDLYLRQQELQLNTFSEVTIIGAGGTGSWIALLLALTGSINTIYIYDDDVVEASNLNRTLYKESHIGMPKVKALKELIRERRPEQIVVEMVQRWDPEKDGVDTGIHTMFDCSDNLEIYKKQKNVLQYYRGGYDGMSFSIYKGQDSGVWDVEDIRGYQMTVSYAIPPMVIAAIMVEDLINRGNGAGLRQDSVITYPNLRALITPSLSPRPLQEPPPEPEGMIRSEGIIDQIRGAGVIDFREQPVTDRQLASSFEEALDVTLSRLRREPERSTQESPRFGLSIEEVSQMLRPPVSGNPNPDIGYLRNEISIQVISGSSSGQEPAEPEGLADYEGQDDPGHPMNPDGFAVDDSDDDDSDDDDIDDDFIIGGGF